MDFQTRTNVKVSLQGTDRILRTKSQIEHRNSHSSHTKSHFAYRTFQLQIPGRFSISTPSSQFAYLIRISFRTSHIPNRKSHVLPAVPHRKSNIANANFYLCPIMPKNILHRDIGCQMNVAGQRSCASVLAEADTLPAAGIDTADIILVNTCSIREIAEQRVGSPRPVPGTKKENARRVIVGVSVAWLSGLKRSCSRATRWLIWWLDQMLP
jgi:hypothetical protein